MTVAIARPVACAILIGVLAASVETAARVALSARVWPSYALAPATVRIEVLIEANADNRVLRIVADSGEYLRSSTIPLEGARAARFHAVMYPSMPAGQYEIDVELWDHAGAVRAMQRHWVNLVP